jgi:hypothetical protein
MMGRNCSTADTGDLPFSYLVGKEEGTFCWPGLNLRSIGTLRDTAKWPGRDRRPKQAGRDLITYDWLSPYTMQCVIGAIGILERLAQDREGDLFTYNNVYIKHSALETGLKLYHWALEDYLSRMLQSRILQAKIKSFDHLIQVVTSKVKASERWVDLAGLIAPKDKVDLLLGDIESGKVKTLDGIYRRFEQLHAAYSEDEWAWVANLLETSFEKPLDQLAVEDFVLVVETGCQAAAELTKLRFEDAAKEFGRQAHTGYGLDGDDMTAKADFSAVRGQYKTNPFVIEFQEQFAVRKKQADAVQTLLQSLSS